MTTLNKEKNLFKWITFGIAFLSLFSVIGVGIFGLLAVGFIGKLQGEQTSNGLKGIFYCFVVSLIFSLFQTLFSLPGAEPEKIAKTFAEPFSFGLILAMYFLFGVGLAKLTLLIKTKIRNRKKGK